MSETKTNLGSSTTTALDLGTVKYKYIPSDKKMHGVNDKSHPLSDGKLDGSIDTLPVLRTRTGQFALVLTVEEEEYIREGLGLEKGDLNPGKRNNAYLESVKVDLPKYGMNLDTNDPYDLLRDKVLQAYDNYIAPNVDSISFRNTYRFVRVAGNEEVKSKNAKMDVKKEAYKLLGQLEESREKMIMYILNTGARVHPEIDSENLMRLVNDSVESSHAKFIATVGDTLFIEKGLLHMGVVVGAVELRSKMYYYEGTPLAFKGSTATIENAAVFIKDKANGDIRLAISKKTVEKFNNK